MVLSGGPRVFKTKGKRKNMDSRLRDFGNDKKKGIIPECFYHPFFRHPGNFKPGSTGFKNLWIPD